MWLETAEWKKELNNVNSCFKLTSLAQDLRPRAGHGATARGLGRNHARERLEGGNYGDAADPQRSSALSRRQR